LNRLFAIISLVASCVTMLMYALAGDGVDPGNV
jgi:hypothetical protein